MIRLAILETEEVAKELLFELMTQLKHREWEFSHFTKISDFAKEDEKKEYNIVIFHEKFDTPRITQSFILSKPKRIVLYTEDVMKPAMKQRHPFQRIFYVDKHHMKNELGKVCPLIELLLKKEEEYVFHYNNVTVPLKISDIYYIEKEDKYLVYHTRRGEFRERKNMKDIVVYFKPFDFLWIHSSYLVNTQYITRIETDRLYIKKIELPISRAHKRQVIDTMHNVISADKNR